ncbi:hypothetical protein LBMAG42_19920 [Deltaproteobacteria bacterium]|nr:hypothetical protein LBMAG42_19920 [Deltaproteobacteria bacterium]
MPTPTFPTSLRVPVLAGTLAWMPTAQAATPEPAPNPYWLRIDAGAVVGQYTWGQTVTGAETALLGTDGDVETVAAGIRLRGRIWAPKFPYLGGEVAYEHVGYAYDPAPVCAAAGTECAGADAIGNTINAPSLLLLLRAPVLRGPTRLAFGARLGLATSQISTATVVDTSVALYQFDMGPLAVGAEGELELASGLGFRADYTAGLTGGFAPNQGTLALEASYAFARHAYLSAGYALSTRNLSITDHDGDEVGTVHDSRGGLRALIGVQL